jgi:hypothetical protein
MSEVVLPGLWVSNDGKVKKLADMNEGSILNCLKKLEVALRKQDISNPDKVLFQMATVLPYVTRPELYELDYDHVKAKIEELKEVWLSKQKENK